MMTTAPSSGSEQTTATTRFGTVTNLRVDYNVKKGLFGGARRETLVMRQIVSAVSETTRHPIWGILLLLVGIVLVLGGIQGQIGALVFGVIIALFGLLLLWGSPRVMLTATDGRARPSTSWPWTRSEAEEFVGAVSQQLLDRG